MKLKDTTKRILKSDLKSNNLIRNIYKFFEIFTKYDGEYYSEDSNRIEVTNLDLLNCQFWQEVIDISLIGQ